MTGWDIFGVGVAVGIPIGVIFALGLALVLAYRDGHPFGETPREEER